MRPTTDGLDNRNARGRATIRSIERVAVRLAQEHGPAALTVDQICDAVGISQRTFFNHFDTKDDALLGWELPRLNEQRVREYLADSGAAVLSGAIALVDLPAEISDEPELARARFSVLSVSPALAERQSARLRPLAAQVTQIVELKLRALAEADIPDDAIRRAAITVTQIAAALLLRPPIVPEDSTAHGLQTGLEDLHWIWPRLI